MGKMLKMRIKPAMIVLSALSILSSFSISMAETNPLGSTEDSKPIIESTDTVYQLDDFGIGDMISNIDDPVKRQKISEYWNMPAWYTNTEQSMEEQKANLFINYDTIKKLIDKPINSLDVEINKILVLNVNAISQDTSKKMFPSFMKVLEERSIYNKDKLTDKVAESSGLEFEDSSVNAAVIGPMSNISKYVTGNYTQGNPGGFGYLMINCKVTWNYDTVTKNITYLAPNTTTGYAYSVFLDPEFEALSVEWVVPGAIDKGVVHKSDAWMYATNPDIPYGYLVVDIVVNGDGTVSKNYADNLPVFSNVYGSYN
jgi:hypothetical protein